MTQTSNFWELAVNATRRAIQLEVVENIQYAILIKTGERNLLLSFGFNDTPNEDDLEALSLMETEIVSDIWSLLGVFEYDWSISKVSPRISNGDGIAIIYERNDRPT